MQTFSRKCNKNFPLQVLHLLFNNVRKKKSFVSTHKVTVGEKKKEKGKANANAKLLALHANAIIFFDIQENNKKYIENFFKITFSF